MTESVFDIRSKEGDFHYNVDYELNAGVGLSEKTLKYISDAKNEDGWIRDFRKKALQTFLDFVLLHQKLILVKRQKMCMVT